jgi:hypothetical protein
MNPRIYKKQAKRAVELLRSHGVDVSGYSPSDDPGVFDPPFRAAKWARIRKYNRRAWQRISGIPEIAWKDWDGCTEVSDARNELMMNHFYSAPSFDNEGNLLPPARINHYRKRDWISTKAISVGWRWRGGRAVEVRP